MYASFTIQTIYEHELLYMRDSTKYLQEGTIQGNESQ